MNPLKSQLTNDRMDVLFHCMRELAKRDPEIPGQVAITFLYIASHNPCHKQALEEELLMSTAAASRNSDYLADVNRIRKHGLGLITKTTDPSNKRRKLLRLTPEGEKLVKQLEDYLSGNLPRNVGSNS